MKQSFIVLVVVVVVVFSVGFFFPLFDCFKIKSNIKDKTVNNSVVPVCWLASANSIRKKQQQQQQQK